IPPPSITSLAHRHGVKVIGTLRFEGKHGKYHLETLFANKQAIHKTVDQLLHILETWEFDGWLVDVEVDIPASIPSVAYFVDILTRRTRCITNYTIWWYDGVDGINGKKRLLNVLDNRSKRVYEVCDGIVTNHKFKPDEMKTKGKQAMRGRSGTVCVGIDVYGRKSNPNVVGWNAHEHVQEAISNKCSAALFAPSWAVEAQENIGADPQENSHRFWTSLSPVMN
ncbi:hypothetical protein PMAYCL1PPCAC_13206, partial [Pristionchus mayeri]